MMIDVFDGDSPTAAHVAARLQDPPPAYRKSTAGVLKILDRPELFDVVDVQQAGRETPVTVAIDLPGATSALVTTSVTTPEETTPATATMAVSGKTLSLPLTSIPVFVESSP